jgi:hypothetical protein
MVLETCPHCGNNDQMSLRYLNRWIGFLLYPRRRGRPPTPPTVTAIASMICEKCWKKFNVAIVNGDVVRSFKRWDDADLI